MRLGTFSNGRSEVDDLFSRFFGSTDQAPLWSAGGYSVPTEVFHMEERLVIRMDLPGVSPDDVDVTVQENTLIVNGKRSFPHGGDVRFLRRGIFYGDFTQRVMLGKGLDVDRISANYDNGVLELSIPYSEEVQPKKISIDFNSGQKSLNA